MADTDKRCGTCKHWTRSDDRAQYGECRIIARAVRVAWMHQTADGTDCPGWTSRHELDRLYATVAEMPDFIRDKMAAACLRSGGACFCGAHISETQE